MEQQSHDRQLKSGEEKQSALNTVAPKTDDMRDITSPVNDITVLLDNGSIKRPPDARNLVDKTGAKYTRYVHLTVDGGKFPYLYFHTSRSCCYSTTAGAAPVEY